MTETEQLIAMNVAHVGLIGALMSIIHEMKPDALPAYLDRLKRAEKQLTAKKADDIQRMSLRLQIDAVQDAISA